MEIANILYDFFGIGGFDEMITFPQLVEYLIKLGISVFIVSFMISSLFRLIGYLEHHN